MTENGKEESSSNQPATVYVIISPIKDEAVYIEQTIQSVINQTVKPKLWLIVDDGSADRTPEIIESIAKQVPWISLMYSGNQGKRNTGSAEAIAFKVGYESVKAMNFEYIVKLDGDLRFEEHYFERIFKEFDRDPKLGIASGIYLENVGEDWRPVAMPDYHAAGASKVVRRACFEAIGGFITQPGWDTVDEIRAWNAGWRSRHFDSVEFLHLRNEGSGMGQGKTFVMHGEIFYLTGGAFRFLALKALYRTISNQSYRLAGGAMLLGYLKLLIRNRKRLVTTEERRIYHSVLKERLNQTIAGLPRKIRTIY